MMGRIIFKIKFYIQDSCRRIKWAWQRVFRGYDDTAIWSLDIYIAKIAAPVLKNMRKYKSHPGIISAEVWDAYLQKMQRAMELIARDDCTYTDVEQKEIDVGTQLFIDWFQHLWT